MTSDYDELKDKRICEHCVGEAFLCGLVVKEGVEADCDYCDKGGFTMSIGDMAELVDAAFDKHYRRTAAEPSSFQYAMMKDPEGDYDWEREGSPVVDAIAYAAEIPDAAATDIQSILSDQYGDYEADKMGEETDYGDESYYETKAVGSGNWMDEWRGFENSLRTENRFFSPVAADYLASLFSGVEKLTKPDGSCVMVDAGPETHLPALFRARVFQSSEKLVDALRDLDRELGPPPSIVALAGRMNARGISVFYGATNPSVALAEIRPPVGSRVVTAQFDIIRPLRLLDLAALADVAVDGSIFDPRYAEALEKAAFLETFSTRITQPVMPDDEALDYIITQAVADFLATDKEQPLDGLVFRSAQAPADGVNVVLFHKAARVELRERLKGTEIESSDGYWDEDGWEIEYKVIEWTPKPELTGKDTPPDDIAGLSVDWPAGGHGGDYREVTLRIDLNSVKVEYIEAVQFKTMSRGVSFYSWEKNDDNPF